MRPSDRSLFAVSHALARVVAGHHVGIAPDALSYAAPGSATKPRFAGSGSAVQISISHSGSRVVIAISREVPLGVDLERVARRTLEPPMLDAVLTPHERRSLAALPAGRRSWAFARYWSRKEAVLKATGDGLEISPRAVAVSAPDEDPALLAWPYSQPHPRSVHLYDLERPDGYCAALASLGGPLRQSHHDGDALLGVSS